MRPLASLLLALPLLLAVDCDPPAPPQTEAFACESAFDWDDAGAPESIDLYAWEGDAVYVVDRGCCDQYIEVWDVATCSYVCAPEGGLIGTGDGACPTFFDEAVFARRVYGE